MQIEEEDIKENFIINIKEIFKRKIQNHNFVDLVFLCIGTDRMTGDCLGPIVGTKLESKLEKYNIYNIDIYGTLENNVSYSNICNIQRIIENRHKEACVIIIDSALSSIENVGKVFVQEGKTILGKGLNKKKIELGDISIKGVVGKNYKISSQNFYILQNVSLNEVLKLANIVSDGILEAIECI